MRKFKKRRRKLHTRKVFLLNSILVVFLFLGIGYSLLSTTLIIGGNLTVKEYVGATLYDVLEKAAEEGTYAREFTGEHHDSFTEEPSKKIYHWYAPSPTDGNTLAEEIQNMNNVIFAGQCWKMIRTTDTGGVKMVYNGESENDQCLNTRGNHVGYYYELYENLSNTYYYGTSYSYDKDNNVFSLAGVITTGEIKEGQYTCKGNTPNTTCSTIYLVKTVRDEQKDVSLKIDASRPYWGLGNVYYNPANNSPTYGGYMYNDAYHLGSTDYLSERMLNSFILSIGIYAADSYNYNSESDYYTLNNPSLISSEEDLESSIGKYALLSATGHPKEIYYITAVENGLAYVIELTSGLDLSYYNNNTYTYGDSYTDNGNGTYTINNPTTIHLTDYYNNIENINKKYVCKNAINDTCSEVWHVESTNYQEINYYSSANKYKFSNGFTYNDITEKYTLDNESIIIWDTLDSNIISSLSNHHYTCFDMTGECNTISYVHFYDIHGGLRYIDITDGKNVSEALAELLTNKKDSTIKFATEAWYKRYMMDYTNQLEDTMFCNNRSISWIGGWNPSARLSYLEFGGSLNNAGLSCANITDRFSVSNDMAKLNYPIGQATYPELQLLNNSLIIGHGNFPSSSTMTPLQFYYVLEQWAYTDSGTIGMRSNTSNGDVLRPVISLKPKTEYSSGDGSMEHPYIVDVEAHHYVYSTSEEKTKGVLVSELGSTYQAEIDALNGFGKRVFLKHKIENDRVVSSGVTFQRNGIMYNLIGEGATYNESTGEYNEDSIYYDDNKQTLKEAFGEENCTEYTTPEKYYECTDGSELGAVRASGRVGVEINQWYCRDFQDGTFHCRQY